jgi:hypothetical protein
MEFLKDASNSHVTGTEKGRRVGVQRIRNEAGLLQKHIVI